MFMFLSVLMDLQLEGHCIQILFAGYLYFLLAEHWLSEEMMFITMRDDRLARL